MLCSKCNQKGILNNAGGKDFYYCRTCKTEILLEEVRPATNGEMIDIEEIIRLLDAEKIDADTAAYFNFPSNNPSDYDDSPSDDDDDDGDDDLFDPMFNIGPTSDLRVQGDRSPFHYGPFTAMRSRQVSGYWITEVTFDGKSWFKYEVLY